MEITNELITELEGLAKIRLTDSEKEQFKAELGGILTYIDILNELDTDGVEPLSHTVKSADFMREDRAESSLPRETVTGNAPQEKNGCFDVPRAFE